MPTYTTNYGLAKPLVADAIDEDLWGGYLNDDMDTIDTYLKTANDGIIPTGSVIPFAGTSAPTNYLLCYGQAISRSTYATLFGVISTTYGIGDGLTTFNVPDLRGRLVAGQDDMGGSSANRLTGLTDGVDGDVLGAVGGLESTTLTTAQIPAHTHGIVTYNALNVVSASFVKSQAVEGSPTTLQTDSTGGGGAHNNVQPTIILNYIIRT